MKKAIVPSDSRYIPFTQQDYTCVPTSILMIMYRNNMPLISPEELGYHLGLTVPPKDKKLFYNPRISEVSPVAGYGTQIQSPEYDLNKAFVKLDIPLKYKPLFSDKIKNVDGLISELLEIEKNNEDALLCFNSSVANKLPYRNGGHVVVFDRMIDGKVRIIDAWYKNAKWQLYEPELLYKAIKRHGSEKAGGIWRFVKNG